MSYVNDFGSLPEAVYVMALPMTIKLKLRGSMPSIRDASELRTNEPERFKRSRILRCVPSRGGLVHDGVTDDDDHGEAEADDEAGLAAVLVVEVHHVPGVRGVEHDRLGGSGNGT